MEREPDERVGPHELRDESQGLHNPAGTIADDNVKVYHSSALHVPGEECGRLDSRCDRCPVDEEDDDLVEHHVRPMETMDMRKFIV